MADDSGEKGNSKKPQPIRGSQNGPNIRGGLSHQQSRHNPSDRRSTSFSSRGGLGPGQSRSRSHDERKGSLSASRGRGRGRGHSRGQPLRKGSNSNVETSTRTDESNSSSNHGQGARPKQCGTKTLEVEISQTPGVDSVISTPRGRGRGNLRGQTPQRRSNSNVEISTRRNTSNSSPNHGQGARPKQFGIKMSEVKIDQTPGVGSVISPPRGCGRGNLRGQPPRRGSNSNVETSTRRNTNNLSSNHGQGARPKQFGTKMLEVEIGQTPGVDSVISNPRGRSGGRGNLRGQPPRRGSHSNLVASTRTDTNNSSLNHGQGARPKQCGTKSLGSARGNEERSILLMKQSTLQKIKDKQPEEIIFKVTSPSSGLQPLLESKNIDNQLMELLLHVLCKALDAQQPESINILLTMINESSFIHGPLSKYMAQMLITGIKSCIKYIVKIMEHLMQKFPHSSVHNTTVILSQCSGIEDQMDEKSRSQLKSMRDQRAETVEQIQENEALPEDIRDNEDFLKPPEDFRKLPVVPTTADIFTDQEPFLRKNKVYGGYQSAEHYLDVQFRLLREDFVCPLREGINELLRLKKTKTKNMRQLTDIKVYSDVHIDIPITTNNGVVYRVRFDMSNLKRVRWESSKRLIFGSLVCLSPDNFKTLLFGTVAERNIEELKKGSIFISFDNACFHLLVPNPSIQYEMVECSAYFEAYRHNLEGLQELTEDTLPFKEYLLSTQSDGGITQSPRAPRYLRGRGAVYDMNCLIKDPEKANLRTFELLIGRNARPVPVLDTKTWPSADEMGLDESQYKALQTGLTKEFAIIQGPPGTGKTFLGLKIVEVLLNNRDEWNPAPRSPILVVCYTNHALDQFLEGIHEFQGILKPGDLIRIGGRCKSEVLEKCVIGEVKRNRETRVRMDNDIRENIARLRDEVDRTKDVIQKILTQLEFAKRNIMHEMFLQHIMHSEHLKSLLAGLPGQTCAIFAWLLCVDQAFHIPHQDHDANEIPVEDFEEDWDEEEVKRLENDRVLEEERKGDKPTEILKEMEKNVQPSTMQTGSVYNPKNKYKGPFKKLVEQKKHILKTQIYDRMFDVMPDRDVINVKNVWQLNENDRWRLYRSWISQYCMDGNMSLRHYTLAYKRNTERLKELRSQEDYQILQRASVIGMTTTGAAKFRSILQRIQPRIVIVEEAAEVLESHIVTTLSPNCQHLILIGDHQQLRPNPTVYRLAKDYHLDISLFERMVKNDLHCDRLLIQHRMRPEIVSLIVPHVYKVLHNHPHVLEYDNVKGINGNMFFINHKEAEMAVEDTKSHSNQHEASYLVALCVYFLLQGYSPSQITVLTMYTGQMFLIKKKMSANGKLQELLGEERIGVTPVDNFQGEENDIILLSLVRSNEEGRIGFLSIHNRVCVALSRARKGLYVIGNINLLEEASTLWKNITKDLRSNDRLVEALPLACQNHPETGIEAKTDKDFDKAPQGGCMRKCESRLECGHVCRLMCHPIDPKHKQYVCYKPCTKTLCEKKHPCPSKCYQECPKCKVLVEKEMPNCGHLQMIPCFLDPKDFCCREPCRKVLPCGHPCPSYCGSPCPERCFVVVESREWPCGHMLKVACFQKPENFPCNVLVDKDLPCGHSAKARCAEKATDIQCSEEVEVTMCEKGHKKKVRCHQENKTKSENCKAIMKKTCSYNSDHVYQVKCVEAEDTPCPLRCTQELLCGHSCAGKCGECHEKNIHSDCKAPCSQTLLCGHMCKGNCGEPCIPCPEPCEAFCGHKPCLNSCGSKCWVCPLPCGWRCQHYVCTSLCKDSCNRPPCNKPCPYKLYCGHLCVGFCGEQCPQICRRCNRDYFTLIEKRLNKQFKPKTRFVFLQPCGHTVDVDTMDALMNEAREPGGPDATILKPYYCPICPRKKAIWFCPRYNNKLKAFAQDYSQMKQKLESEHHSTESLGRTLNKLPRHEARVVRQALLNSNKQNSEQLKLAVGKIGIGRLLEECDDLIQVIKKKNKVVDEYDTHQSLDTLRARREAIEEELKNTDATSLKKCLADIIHLYLLAHIAKVLTFIRNHRVRSTLHSLETSIIHHSTQNMVPSSGTEGNTKRLLLHAETTLLTNVMENQRDGITSYVQRIRDKFQVKTDIVKYKLWLKCSKGHVYCADRSLALDERRCTACHPTAVNRQPTLLDDLFEEERREVKFLRTMCEEADEKGCLKILKATRRLQIEELKRELDGYTELEKGASIADREQYEQMRYSTETEISLLEMELMKLNYDSDNSDV